VIKEGDPDNVAADAPWASFIEMHAILVTTCPRSAAFSWLAFRSGQYGVAW